MALSDKQKEAREAALGSSDAPVVAGVSPRKSPLELYYQLHGELPRYTQEETLLQKLGSRLEPILGELAAEELGLKIRRCPTRQHTVYPWMVANLDFEIVAHARGPGALEVKNRSGLRPFDTLPDDILLQVIHQLAVTNREWAVVAVLFQFGQLRTYPVERDRELELYLVQLEYNFITRVQTGDPPDIQWTPATLDLLKRLYPRSTGTTVELPAHYLESVRKFLEAKQMVSLWEETKAGCEGDLKEAIREAEWATLPGYRISWKSTKDGKRFNEELFAKEHPALYAQYQQTVPGYRRFMVRQKEETDAKSIGPSRQIEDAE